MLRPMPLPPALRAAAVLLLAACTTARTSVAPSPPPMSSIAERYVKLVLAVGEHDADYVDAYYGPAAWREQAHASKRPLAELRAAADSLSAALGPVPAGADEMDRLRHAFLARQLAAVAARVDMLQGRRFTFDEESRALYDAVAPTLPESHFQAVLDELSRALPGDGAPSASSGQALPERYQAWRRQFVVAPERVDAVFEAAVDACRARTAQFVPLPAGETFTIEYVKDKPWSGYNWYKGDLTSLIQVNTSLPIYIDRALDLACHEGYPGHHVYNALLEQELVRKRGWVELTVYPLFSPMSLIAEGSANYGIEMAFPGEERVVFERERLWPLAGLDPARAAEYYRVQELVRRLGYAGNEAARRYLNGEIDRAAAAAWLARYALMSEAAAAQRVRFFDTYRSYVINYNLGQDLVKAWVEREAGPGATPARRWAVFRSLLASPRLPAGLR
jgi:hypothetical protein